MGSGAVKVLEGTFAERVAAYTGVCGSLASDLGVAITSFFVLACCAGTETAITTLWPWKVREFAQQERERGQRGKWNAVRQDIQRFMQTILIGTTLSGVLSASFITEMCGQLFGPRGLGIAAVSVSFIQLTIGEIIPKLLAVSNPVVFCHATLPIFYRISAVVYPFSRFLNTVLSLGLKAFGISVDTSKTPLVSEAELDLMFNSAMKSGVVDAEEGDMIRSVRNLDRQSVKDVMTPLVDMVGIEAQQPISRLHEMWKETAFSRVPVYSNRFDSIVGVVSMKSLLKHAPLFSDGNIADQDQPVEQLCDSAVFVPETMSLLTALRLLKERTIAICVDEYGGTTGLVTLEDVLEQIVGDIYDADEEKDEAERVQNSSKIKQIGEGQWSMSGIADISDVNIAIGVALPDGDYNSIGGFVCMHIDRIPEVGEAVLVETASKNVRFTVLEVDDRRVIQVEAFVEMEEVPNSDRVGKVLEDDEEEQDQVLDVRPEEKDSLDESKEEASQGGAGTGASSQADAGASAPTTTQKGTSPTSTPKEGAASAAADESKTVAK